MGMDTYAVEQLLDKLARSVDDLAYRIYTIEDSVAALNAHIEEKLEEENA